MITLKDWQTLSELHSTSTPGEWSVQDTNWNSQKLLRLEDDLQLQMPTTDAQAIAATHNALPGVLESLKEAMEVLEQFEDRYHSDDIAPAWCVYCAADIDAPHTDECPFTLSQRLLAAWRNI